MAEVEGERRMTYVEARELEDGGKIPTWWTAEKAEETRLRLGVTKGDMERVERKVDRLAENMEFLTTQVLQVLSHLRLKDGVQTPAVTFRDTLARMKSQAEMGDVPLP